MMEKTKILQLAMFLIPSVIAGYYTLIGALPDYLSYTMNRTIDVLPFLGIVLISIAIATLIATRGIKATPVDFILRFITTCVISLVCFVLIMFTTLFMASY